ncbi:acetyl-CoA acyltransferase [Nocardia sp. GAS34]|uniref:thiolase family protein n=1 Tax=unclassified Nocardia TaxID=2637762 RepID=UPI003D1DE89D
MNNAVIVDVVRTPSGKGKPGGALFGVHPAELLATVLRELVSRNDIDPALVEDVITGCVGQGGEQSINIGRTAVLAAGFPETVPATTVDRQCGSSQQAAQFAAQAIMAGTCGVVIAAGVESMSRVPMFSQVMGKDPNVAPLRHRFPDGLVAQGISAELLAVRWKLDRARLDEFAARSHRLAATVAAAEAARQVVPVEVVDSDGNRRTMTTDETVRPATTVEGLATLSPVFRDDAIAVRFPEIDWRITAGNSSPLTDGASAALIMSETTAAALNLTPRARFHSFVVTGSDPLLMLDGVLAATEKVLGRAGLGIDDIDAYEVNEAFAPVPLLWEKHFGTDPDKLNPAGGAIALGHPLGASGGRLLASLVNHLESTGGRYGLQTMCEGGGMANATVIERL